ncbi:MAG: histone deacetylase [Blastocatellia bacterium]
MATGLIYSDEYLKHDTGNHPECPERYGAAVSGLMAECGLWDSLVRLAPREASYEDLLRCHTERVLERIGHACLEAEFYEHAALDTDTRVSRQSDLAARLAAGGACRAVDAVLTGESESAFVACRPPGHHATVTASMGFCLYNNVAIAARYAQMTYPREIENVLIMDFDVHHGNGTQDIFYADPTVFYYSLHQYPWYPGTGAENERGARDGEGFTLNVPVQASTPPEEYLQMFDEGLDTALKRFSPDLVIISAGFDAHQSDPLGQLRLNDESYRHMTRRLKEAAPRGRVVSCLEGGYNLSTLGGTVAAHVGALE